MHSITLGRISIAVLEPTARPGPGLQARLALWLRMRRTQAEMDQADPRILTDLGAPPRGADPVKAAFVVDPAPLWGIGQVPRPREGGRR